jgi:hypothetical protein
MGNELHSGILHAYLLIDFIVCGCVVTPHLHNLGTIDLRPWMREELKTSRNPDKSGLRVFIFPNSKFPLSHRSSVN